MLTGTVSSELSQQSLRYVDLSSNCLSGVLPKLLASPSLSAVNLSSNVFTGTLPDVNKTVLSSLDCSSTGISGTIPTVYGGQSLRYLALADTYVGMFVVVCICCVFESGVVT